MLQDHGEAHLDGREACVDGEFDQEIRAESDDVHNESQETSRNIENQEKNEKKINKIEIKLILLTRIKNKKIEKIKKIKRACDMSMNKKPTRSKELVM